MSKAEGGCPIDPPPSRLGVTIFSRRLLGLKMRDVDCRSLILLQENFAIKSKPRVQATVALAASCANKYGIGPHGVLPISHALSHCAIVSRGRYWVFLHCVAKFKLKSTYFKSFAQQKIQYKHAKKGVISYFA